MHFAVPGGRCPSGTLASRGSRGRASTGLQTTCQQIDCQDDSDGRNHQIDDGAQADQVAGRDVLAWQRLYESAVAPARGEGDASAKQDERYTDHQREYVGFGRLAFPSQCRHEQTEALYYETEAHQSQAAALPCQKRALGRKQHTWVRWR